MATEVRVVFSGEQFINGYAIKYVPKNLSRSDKTKSKFVFSSLAVFFLM